MSTRPNYELLPGNSGTEPQIYIDQYSLDILGEPNINHQELHRMLTDNVGVPYDLGIEIVMNGMMRGKHTGYFSPKESSSIYLNPIKSEISYPTQGVMNVIAHECKHLADYHSDENGFLMDTVKQIGISSASGILAGSLATISIASTGITPAKTITMLTAGAICSDRAFRFAWGMYYLNWSKSEKNAQEAERLIGNHMFDILFPNSPRTENLKQRLSHNQKVQLNLPNFMFDNL